MQSNDGPFRIGPTGGSAGSDQGNRPESIREAQRRRRQATRVRADVEAILAAPEDEEDEEEVSPPAPPPAKVYVVFRGAKWMTPMDSSARATALSASTTMKARPTTPSFA